MKKVDFKEQYYCLSDYLEKKQMSTNHCFRYTDGDGMNSIISYEDITKHKKYPKEGDQVITTNHRGVHAGFVKFVDDDGGKGYVRIDWSCKEPHDYGYYGYTLWLFVHNKSLKLFREGVELRYD